jgi:hypothetical protein
VSRWPGGFPHRTKRLGVRQPSGALERRTGRAGRSETISLFRLRASALSSNLVRRSSFHVSEYKCKRRQQPPPTQETEN